MGVERGNGKGVLREGRRQWRCFDAGVHWRRQIGSDCCCWHFGICLFRSEVAPTRLMCHSAWCGRASAGRLYTCGVRWTVSTAMALQ